MYEYVGTAGWQPSSVYDLANWKNGLAFKNIDFSDTGRPIIKIAELKNGVTAQTARTMAEYDHSVFVQPRDMLFSWSGNPDTSIDVFRWEGEEGWLNQHIFKVTPRKGISNEFLFFVLRWLRPRFAEIARNKQTTGLGHVTIQDLKRMMVGVPTPNEQDAIVSIIGPIQGKIDLNHRINESLEAMARAIFKDWLVDFGPTRAKIEGQAPYLTPDIWSLFPDDLDSEGVPVGWKTGTLDELIEIAPSEPMRKGEVTPYLDMAALPTRGSTSASPVYREYSSGTRFRNRDALLARITPCLENGKTAFVQNLPADTVGWGSTEFIVMRSISPVPRAVAYLLAREPSFRRHAIQSMTGTSGRQRASSEAISAYPITIPSDDHLWVVLESILAPLFDKVAANAEEIQTLEATRNLLLPKLMSGEIRVKDAEKLIGDAP